MPSEKSEGFSEEAEKGVNVNGNVTGTVNVNATVTGKKEKSIKKEKPPKRQYGEFVSLTETEHGTLVDKHGADAAGRMIEILDNYKGANPVKRYYNSDYRAILSWVVDKYYSALADGVKGAANDAGMLSEIDKAKRRVREGYG